MSTPIAIASQLSLLQEDIRRKLNSEYYFNDIPVFAVRDRTVEAVIAGAIMGTSYKQGKTGIAVQVIMPSASVPPSDDNVHGPHLLVSYIVRVQEYPLINMGSKGTQKPAEDVAINILNMLHHYDFGRSIADFRASPNALVASVEHEPRLTYDVEFYAAYQLPDVIPLRTPTPTASIDSSFVLTLNCSDANARIYWTNQEQNYPSSSEGGVLYTAPFQTTVGQIIRCAAYNDSLQSSTILPINILP